MNSRDSAHYPCLYVLDPSKLQIAIDGDLYIDLEDTKYRGLSSRVFNPLLNLKELLCFVRPPKDHYLFNKSLQRVVDRCGNDRVYVSPHHALSVIDRLAALIVCTFPQEELKDIAAKIRTACTLVPVESSILEIPVIQISGAK